MHCNIEGTNKKKGGIKSIKLIDAREFKSVRFSGETACFCDYELSEGAEFCNISYYEDSAYYNETTTLDKSHSRVQHSLSFALCDSDQGTLSFIDKILSGQTKGVIALVTTNNSETYLIGYSRQFQTERALKLSSASSDSAYTPASRPMICISLSSEDTHKSIKYI